MPQIISPCLLSYYPISHFLSVSSHLIIQQRHHAESDEESEEESEEESDVENEEHAEDDEYDLLSKVVSHTIATSGAVTFTVEFVCSESEDCKPKLYNDVELEHAFIDNSTAVLEYVRENRVRGLYKPVGRLMKLNTPEEFKSTFPAYDQDVDCCEAKEDEEEEDIDEDSVQGGVGCCCKKDHQAYCLSNYHEVTFKNYFQKGKRFYQKHCRGCHKEITTASIQEPVFVCSDYWVYGTDCGSDGIVCFKCQAQYLVNQDSYVSTRRRKPTKPQQGKGPNFSYQ